MSLRTAVFLTALLTISAAAFSQTTPFDASAYQSFLTSHRDLSTEQFLALHPAGTFEAGAPVSFATVPYGDSIALKFGLTSYERSLLDKHGFMVTERIPVFSFGDAFRQIYHKDLPAFVSTDAILHAWHMSYDAILMDVEERTLIRKLDTLLTALHAQIPALASAYQANPAMQQMLRDVDLYLTVPRKLLGNSVDPVFVEDLAPVADLLAMITAAQPAQYPLFQSVPRVIDFSQFTPRGHYTQSEALKKYFQAMMWLGRTEICVLPPRAAGVKPAEPDLQRQAIDALLIDEAAVRCDGHTKLDVLDRVIRYFVGEPDNITLPQLHALAEETSLPDAAALLDTLVFRNFCDALVEKSYAYQQINSQILESDIFSTEQIRPAGAFMLLGQRFVVDSYVTGNVVFDQILFEGRKMLRMLPSALDVLAALGNDAAPQLLVQDLDQYHYGSNLAALRYLIDGYDARYWESSLYKGWLHVIRTLNPPESRKPLPPFMQTAAWWQEKINTQLASWAQLRHDNLLYAKQSYTGVPICSFPETYVEPIPEFYRAMRTLADSARMAFASPLFSDFLSRLSVIGFFEGVSATCDTLAAVAEKELSGNAFTPEERAFLGRILYETNYGCVPSFHGWYPNLFYTGENGLMKQDLVVADVHTTPADSLGDRVGWVVHAGTGPVNMAVVAATLPGGRTVACIGPVVSYYEHITTNFKRLTDEEWKTLYAQPPSLRPSFVNLYLADATGQSRGTGQTLLTGLDTNPADPGLPGAIALRQNYPNPFNATTVIVFSIPPRLSGTMVELAVYDLQGRLVRTLFREPMSAGNFVARWDATRDDGRTVASGVYFYRVRAGTQMLTGRMALIK